MNRRFLRGSLLRACPALLGLVAVALIGCPAPSQSDAAVEEFEIPADRVVVDTRPVGPDGQPPSDVSDIDATLARDGSAVGDGATRDGADGATVPPRDVVEDTTATMGLDVTVPDASFGVQPCSLAATPVAFGAGGRGSRPVYVRSNFTGFQASATVLREGADNVWLQRVDRDGAPVLVGNITGRAVGRAVRGGSFAQDSMFYSVVWAETVAGVDSIGFRRMQSNFLEVGGSEQVLATGPSLQQPEIVQTPAGLLVIWRAIESGRGILRGVSLTSVSVGTVTDITGPTDNVGEFRLVGSVDADVYAVAWRNAATPSIQVTPLRSTGAAAMAPLSVATGADLGPSVDATLEDDGDVWVSFARPADSAAVRFRRITLAAGDGTSAELSVPSTMGAQDVAVALDTPGIVLAWRAPTRTPASIDLARIDAAGTVRDTSRVVPSGPGGRPGIAAGGGGYGLGWTDDAASGAITRIAAVHCR
ncbi:MAG: hypothetical protein Q8Q09_13600 [Deltaproteobacteria bacterium]|nr:hypothetical protein [Deltaproteobacteria bacterium]